MIKQLCFSKISYPRAFSRLFVNDSMISRIRNDLDLNSHSCNRCTTCGFDLSTPPDSKYLNINHIYKQLQLNFEYPRNVNRFEINLFQKK